MSTTTATTIATQPTVLRTGQDGAPSAENDHAFQALARGDQQGVMKLRGIPTFTDLHAKRQWIRQHMAAVFRFLESEDGEKGFLAISLYESTDPILPDHFWMNSFAMHFSLIKASDLVLVDSRGYVVEGGNQAMINEAGFMIHSEVHRARPEVMAVAHTHSIYGKTWSSFGKPIEMLTQDACNFYGKLSVYEDHGGIALAQDEGRAIANALGKTSMAAILQNHGLITLGSTVDEAGFLFYSLEKACHSQLLAEAAAANGVPKKIIPDNVAQFTADSVQTPNNFYLEFQPEFDLVVVESKGEVLE